MAGRDYRVTIGTVSGLPLSGSAADGVAATDVASWQMDGVRTASDPVGLTDAVAVIASILDSLADSVGLTDSVSAVLGALQALLTEAGAVLLTESGVTIYA